MTPSTTRTTDLLEQLIDRALQEQATVVLDTGVATISGVPEAIDTTWMALRIVEPLADEGREQVQLVRRDQVTGLRASLGLLHE